MPFIRTGVAMPDNYDELLRELFWSSQLRIAVIDTEGRFVLSSKAFRDSFSGMIALSGGGWEILGFNDSKFCESFFSRLATLPPGERISFSLRVPFAGIECSVRVETSALHSESDGKALFLTEWIPEQDQDEVSQALDEIDSKYRNLQENLPVGIYRALDSGILQTANTALIRMMGFDSFEELQNARLSDVWVDTAQRSAMIDRLRNDGSVLDYEVRLRRKNGEILIASFDARGTFDTDGNLEYFDTIVQNISQRVLAKSELERLARTDSLTGLSNRQHLIERLGEETARVGRYDRPLSVMLIDLDHFKEVNDTHGHLAGDAVLVSAASSIHDILRGTDFAGRYGGEEFCVVMPETGIDGAEELAERLRKAMEVTEHPLPDGSSIRVTCSIGVTEVTSGTAEDAIAVADIALYTAKRAGRNRVKCMRENISGRGRVE
jgi:diguanylate cyclase (GGDEF)-like protein/PAS domain S-box-containing protein